MGRAVAGGGEGAAGGSALDGVLSDPELLAPIVDRWRWESEQTGRLVLGEGRPTIAMETYVRLMVLSSATGGDTGR